MDKIKGEGGGGGGKGVSQGGVEGWGERAHNCNWITIKKNPEQKKRKRTFKTKKKKKISNNVNFFQIFSIHRRLNPWMQNQWIQRANGILFSRYHQMRLLTSALCGICESAIPYMCVIKEFFTALHLAFLTFSSVEWTNSYQLLYHLWERENKKSRKKDYVFIYIL